MMKLILIYIMLILTSCSCQDNGQADKNDEVRIDTLSIKIDSNEVYKEEEPQPISCKCEEDTNSIITKIPIQLSSVTDNWKITEKGGTPVSYKLPNIKRFTYIPLDFYETHYINGNKEIDDFKEPAINNIFSKYCCYKLRLPDINNYQTYLVYDEDNEYFAWSLKERTHCRLGFLMFYDVSIEQAVVFTIELCGGGGEGSSLPYKRVTSIDKKFNVTIQDYEINFDWDNDDEYGNPKSEIYKGAKYLISVLPTGNIKVTYPKWAMSIYEPEKGNNRYETIPTKEIVYASDGSIVSTRILK